MIIPQRPVPSYSVQKGDRAAFLVVLRPGQHPAAELPGQMGQGEQGLTEARVRT